MEKEIINSNVLKDKLWKILSSNRGQLDTSFYKDIALSSFFLFAVNKKYEVELKKAQKKNPDLPKEVIAKEKSFFTIWIPSNARLDYLRQHLNNNFKVTVSQALEGIEKVEENSEWLKDASFANLFY
jgi:type I restriction-modification system DNA methylase subunit